MTAEVVVVVLFVVLVAQRLGELRLARRNEAWARSQGAVEHGGRHYLLFFPLHTGWLLAWPIEAWLMGPRLGPNYLVWVGLFLGAQALRYWAIGTLGRRWNTKILVFPGKPPIERGPYRLLSHPNYVAVVLELVAVPLIVGAWRTAVVVSVLNAIVLLGFRIPAEVEALKASDSKSTD